MFVVFKTRKKGHFWNVKIATKGWRMTGAPSPEFWKAWRVSSQYLEFPAFSRIVVRETCAFHRCGGELGMRLRTPTWRDIAKDCENCREMTAYFGTRPEIKGLVSFSATFFCSVIFRYKKEGREAEKHRDEDHSVSLVQARCQIDSKR